MKPSQSKYWLALLALISSLAFGGAEGGCGREVDVGEDIFVVEDETSSLAKVQVKSAIR